MASADLRRQREEQIAVGALGLFKDKGYHATSIREIASAAGLSMGGLYEYINTKQDVLSLVYRYLISGVEAVGPEDADSLDDMLVALMQGTARHAAEVQLVYRETASLDPEHRSRLAESERAQADMIRSVIEEGVAAGDLAAEDPELAAHLVVFLTAFFPLRRWLLRHRQDLGPDEAARAVAKLMMEGLRAR